MMLVKLFYAFLASATARVRKNKLSDIPTRPVKTSFIWEFGDINERRNKSIKVLGKLDEWIISGV